MESHGVVDGINEAAVRDVLSAVRYSRSVDSPLARLRVVDAWMRDSGIAPTAENAAWSLASLLQELVSEELARVRESTGSRPADPPGQGRRGAVSAPADDLAWLVADFRSGSSEREAWSALNVRFLSPTGIRMADVPDLVGTSRATLARRLNEGLTRLASLLRERERAACRQARHRRGAPVTDRIVVARGANGAESGFSWPVDEPDSDTVTVAATLLAAVRDDSRVVRLSARECTRIARLPVTDLTSYRLARIAEWSRPQYKLDERFVDLTLLVDRGEDAEGERWQAQPERLGSLQELLERVPDSAFVVLGSPGAGKSTMLRRLELDLAVAGLRGTTRAVPFMVHLGMYRPSQPGGEAPAPRAWLAEQWATRYPRLPSLESILDRGGAVLLLDALNEIPRRDMAEHRDQVTGWKSFAQAVAGPGRSNRVVFTCRSLEYSAPLSSPGLRVPQVRLEPLSDCQVADFLRAYSPGRADELWTRLRRNPRLDLVRTPYFLKLLVQLMTADDEVPQGRAALFTGFLRQAVAREVGRDNPLFLPDGLLSERDYGRVIRARRWKTPWELPSRGPLFPALSNLAWRMQQGEPLAEAAQVRVDYDTALDMMRPSLDGDATPGGGRTEAGTGGGRPRDPQSGADPKDMVRAGVALGVLDEDVDGDHVLFFHQLLQEYFAGRRAAADPRPDVTRVAWREDAQVPPLAAVLQDLGPAEPLPPLPRSNWEETTLMAAEMAADKGEFIEALAGANLPLAGQAAVQPLVRQALPPETLDRLRAALVARSRDPKADLRSRIEAGRALGRLGDPRLSCRRGPHGPYREPPMVVIEAGHYTIGSDEAYDAIGKSFYDHTPAHSVSLASFGLGVFPVTNAEYGLFVAAGGYDDDRWWDTEAAWAWRRGEGTGLGERLRYRYWTRVFGAQPELLEELHVVGRMDDDAVARWQRWTAMTDLQLDEELMRAYPDKRYTAPGNWHDHTFSNPAQPVSAVTWYEARAYCHWLAAQMVCQVRLPSEAEWEAAARGPEARSFAFGDSPDPLLANELGSHIQRPTPVGCFPRGDTPTGLADMCGNVAEWTASRWGADPERPRFSYPYRADDGREAPDAPPEERRALRGGAFYLVGSECACYMRSRHHPTERDAGIGFRVAVSGG